MNLPSLHQEGNLLEEELIEIKKLHYDTLQELPDVIVA